MSCKDFWKEQLAGPLAPVARIAPGQVDGGLRCDHAGCTCLVNLATGKCVVGHTQAARDQRVTAAQVAAALRCLANELGQKENAAMLAASPGCELLAIDTMLEDCARQGLGDDDPRLRAARLWLGQLQARVGEEWQERQVQKAALQSRHTRVRQAAIRALLGDKAEEATELLEQVLAQPLGDERLRTRVFKELMRRRGPSVVGVALVWRGLDDPVATIRQAAIRQAVRLGLPNLPARLATMMRTDKTALVRGEAAKHLQELAGPAEVPALIAELAAGHTDRAYIAGQALLRIGGAETVAALGTAMENSADAGFRDRALRLLGESRSAAAVPFLERHLLADVARGGQWGQSHYHPSQKALQQIPGPEAEAAVVKAMREAVVDSRNYTGYEQTQRLAAAAVLAGDVAARGNGAAATQVLAPLLRGEHEGVLRYEVLPSLGRAAQTDEQAVAVLRQVAQGDFFPPDREQMITAFRLSRRDEFVPDLAAWAQDYGPYFSPDGPGGDYDRGGYVREAAVKALCEIGSPAAGEALAGVLLAAPANSGEVHELAEGVGELGGPRAAPALRHALRRLIGTGSYGTLLVAARGLVAHAAPGSAQVRNQDRAMLRRWAARAREHRADVAAELEELARQLDKPQ